MGRFSNFPYRTEAEAAKFLDKMRWPNGVFCPGCGNTDRPIYDMSKCRGVPSTRNPNGKVRHGLRKCGACRLEFRATFGTPFHGLKVPLDVLLAAIFLHDNPQQISSVAGLSRALGIKRETVSRIFAAADVNERVRLRRVEFDKTMSARSLSLEVLPNRRR